MAIAAVDFTGSLNTSADELGGSIPVSSNVLIDASGVITRRPGVSAWDAFPQSMIDGVPVIGMTVYRGNLVWVTEDRRIRSVNPQGMSLELSDATAATKLDGGLKPSFVSGRNMLVIAGGAQMQEWRGVGLSYRMPTLTPGQPPPPASHVSGIAQRLVVSAPSDSGQIWWSAPLEAYEDWDFTFGAAGFIQAAAKPDPIVAMFDNTNEVLCFGADTIQVFDPSATTIDSAGEQVVFTPTRTMNLGLIGRDAIVQVDDMFMMVDSNRRIVLTDARSYEDKGNEIVKTIREMAKANDAWGFRMRFGKHDCVVFMFPSSGKGYIYEIKAGRWSTWTAFDKTGPTNVKVTAACYWPDLGKVMVGLADGSICYLADSSGGDLGDDIKAEIVSGFTDRGSSQQKWCKSLMLTFRREPGTVQDGFVRIYSRDNLGAFHFRNQINLGEKLQNTVIFRSLGTYRQRQWKIEYTGKNPFSLVSAQEDFEILGV